jgi:hypothetical protein
MKVYAILSILAVFLCAFQCETAGTPEPNNDVITVLYGETQCSNPWQHGSTDAETLSKVEAFLRDKNIRFTGTTIVPAPEGVGYCQACTCASGRVIKGTVHKDDLEKIKALNFVPGS